MSWVYYILNSVNDKMYVGSAACVKSRWKNHLNELRANRHINGHLQAAWNKYGEAAFVFDVLEECEESVRLAREQYYLDCFESYDQEKGYNILKVAGSAAGFRHTDEAKQTIADAVVEQWKDEEHRKRRIEKMVAASNLSELSKARWQDSEYRTTMLATLLASRIGSKHSEETRKKMSADRIGRKHTDAAKAKMSASRKGKKRGEEFSRVMSEAAKKREAKKREERGL